MASYHSRPLFFYGSFVSLSEGEKLDFCENQVVNYYKCVVSDQNEAMDQMMAEIDYLKDLTIEYRDLKQRLEKELAES